MTKRDKITTFSINQLVILFNEYWKELKLWTTFLSIILVASSSCFPQQVVRSSARSQETLKWRAFEINL